MGFFGYATAMLIFLPGHPTMLIKIESFLCKSRPLLFKPHWIYKNKIGKEETK